MKVDLDQKLAQEGNSLRATCQNIAALVCNGQLTITWLFIERGDTVESVADYLYECWSEDP
jgi:hypothetical protein